MNDTKKFWKWDERYNNTDFKLGEDITTLLKKNLITPDPEDENEFFGKNGNPWKIRVERGIIVSIFYRKTFFPFINKGNSLWEMEWKEFCPTISKVLDETNEDHKGDLLFVAFRAYYVAIVGIMRK